jgi:8-oxo-dGTP pyrophosphatase MutT (NUDIX family)
MLKVLKSRFINPFLYRPNVACFVYKKTADTIKILLVERTDEQGHWQLPQGGTDGEDLASAGKRELKEEVNISNLINQKVFPNVSSYIFPKKYWHQNHKIYKYDYKGQKQGLFVAEFTGDDSEIKTNYWDHRGWQWLDLDQALNTIHPVRQKNFQLFLEKFKSLNI